MLVKKAVSTLESIHMPGPRGFRHPIYGTATRKKRAGPCCDTIDEIYAQFYKIVEQVQSLVDRAVDTTSLTLEIIGQVEATASVHIRVYVRLVWRAQYAGVRFDDQNPIHVAQIVDIYKRIKQGVAAPDDPLMKTEIGLTVLRNDTDYYFSTSTNSYIYKYAF